MYNIDFSEISEGISEISGLVYKDESYALIGAAMEVHKTLGCGFLEAVYSHALCAEMDLRNIHTREKQEF